VQAAEAATGAQQTEPEPQPAGGGSTKKDKERQRKERQRRRKMEEAMDALDGAMAVMARTASASSVKAVEAAMQAVAKHDGRSEPLAALVAEARGMLEQARAAEAERVRVAAEEAAAAAAVEAERAKVAAEAVAAAAAVEAEAEAAETEKRQRIVAELAALDLRTKQLHSELGSGSGTPQLQPDEESQCVLCLDAPNDHIITPCGHQCVCGACAEKLKRVKRNPA
jgi:nucleoid-associated protein YgaU